MAAFAFCFTPQANRRVLLMSVVLDMDEIRGIDNLSFSGGTTNFFFFLLGFFFRFPNRPTSTVNSLTGAARFFLVTFGLLSSIPVSIVSKSSTGFFFFAFLTAFRRHDAHKHNTTNPILTIQHGSRKSKVLKVSNITYLPDEHKFYLIQSCL